VRGVVHSKLDALVKLKSNETTGNLGKNVRNNVRHRNLAGSSHHNRNRRVEVTARNMAAEHDGDCQSSTDGNRVTSGDDDIEEKNGSEELNQILVQHYCACYTII